MDPLQVNGLSTQRKQGRRFRLGKLSKGLARNKPVT